MGEMKRKPVATLIGDLVDSRGAPDRDALHRRFRAAIDGVNRDLAPVTPLRITVGDEFQGAFASVGEAIHAGLRLRLELLPEVDVRHGIGWGEVFVLDEEPRVEDGPGWWAARDAIEVVEAEMATPGLRRLRSRYARAAQPGPEPTAINAALLCRDQLLDGGDARAVRLLRGMLAGQTQTELADQEGISPSAVSQRVRKDGLAAVLAAEALLREVA